MVRAGGHRPVDQLNELRSLNSEIGSGASGIGHYLSMLVLVEAASAAA